MKKNFKRAVAFLIAASTILALATSVFAIDFIDMPNNWTTEALKNAVKNGILYGEETKQGMKINPDGDITRAQAAAIIVRAFGAKNTKDISKYVDADPKAWYYTELSKAVYMDAFRGDGNKMNPNNNITFQECFTVVSQILKLTTTAEDEKCLDRFSDKNEVSEWAIPYVQAVVQNGLWDGIDGKLYPKKNITRSQFAVLMDNMVDTYIDTPGEYTNNFEGNVMIRCDNVTFKNNEIKGSVIIGDAVQKGIVFDATKINGYLYARGGEDTELREGTSMRSFVALMKGTRLKFAGKNQFSEKGYAGKDTYIFFPSSIDLVPKK